MEDSFIPQVNNSVREFMVNSEHVTCDGEVFYLMLTWFFFFFG